MLVSFALKYELFLLIKFSLFHRKSQYFIAKATDIFQKIVSHLAAVGNPQEQIMKSTFRSKRVIFRVPGSDLTTNFSETGSQFVTARNPQDAQICQFDVHFAWRDGWSWGLRLLQIRA